MANNNDQMCIDHCAMVQCATNAKAHYYSLKSQVKDSKANVSDLEKKLKEAKVELRDLSGELTTQSTIVDVFVNLCNHNDVRVLKGEGSGNLSDPQKDIIDLLDLSSDEDDKNSTEKKSNIITPVKEGDMRKVYLYQNQTNTDDDDSFDKSVSDAGAVPSKKRRV